MRRLWHNAAYLLFEQWHLPLADPESLPDISSECSCSWHLFLYGAADRGGFPEDGAAGAKKIDGPCFPFETLPSPVIAEDIKEELDETLKLSLVNSSSALFVLEPNRLGFVKSRVKLCGGCDWTKLAGAVTADGLTTWVLNGAGCTVAGARVRVWEWGREREADDEEGEEDEEEDWRGPRRKRAWPVRLRREITFLNLETVRSVKSVQSTWFSVLGWWDNSRIRCSMPLRPWDAASCMAVWSSIFGKLMRSTAIFDFCRRLCRWKQRRERRSLEREREGFRAQKSIELKCTERLKKG